MTDNTNKQYRISNLDFLRGLVIVIMALDHVRDYVGIAPIAQSPTGDEASLATFFTRIITHLCAPIFVFLAGTSAGLMAARRSPNSLAWLLTTRGLWLVLLELTLVSFLWTFNLSGIKQMGGNIALNFGVIGAIGVGMFCLGLLQYLGARACLILGLVIVLGHNALYGIWPDPVWGQATPLWVSLLRGMGTAFGPFSLYSSYPPLPWFGIMLVGFGSAALFTQTAPVRNRWLLVGGVSMLILFCVLRATRIYGDPTNWLPSDSLEQSIRSFVDVTKYPPSLQFSLLTLGIGALIMALSGQVATRVFNVLVTYGKAPFAFYLAHLFVIHLAAIGLGVWQGFEPSQFQVYFFLFPEGYGVNLTGVYLFWFAIVALLYPLVNWVATVKARRKDWWLSYL